MAIVHSTGLQLRGPAIGELIAMAGTRDAMPTGPELLRAELAPPREDLLDKPLDYVQAEHFRHRSLCAALRRIAEARTCSHETASVIVEFLTHDLPLHHRDEDEDIFPIVLQRSVPEDGLAAILAQLAEDHRKAQRQAAKIVEALAVPGADDKIELSPQTVAMMRTYARNEHRHLAIENGIVLVIARKRLKPSDLLETTRTMRQRRGLTA